MYECYLSLQVLFHSRSYLLPENFDDQKATVSIFGRFSLCMHRKAVISTSETF